MDWAMRAGAKWRTQAAASTMPSGSPATSRQISTTPGAVSAESAKPACACWARSTNNCTALDCQELASVRVVRGRGSGRALDRSQARRRRERQAGEVEQKFGLQAQALPRGDQRC